MNKNNCYSPPFSLIALAWFALLIAGIPALAEAGTWYVTNTGADGASCGRSRDHACRSINQAIDNASSGDVIWVGAGQYGAPSGSGGCAVCITKGVQIYSYNGTSATVIEASPDYDSVVQ